MVLLEVPVNSPTSPPRAARAISPFSGLPQGPTETIAANTLMSLTVRDNARRELERLRSPLHATHSTSSLVAPVIVVGTFGSILLDSFLSSRPPAENSTWHRKMCLLLHATNKTKKV